MRLALEIGKVRHHGHRQDAQFLGDLGHDRAAPVPVPPPMPAVMNTCGPAQRVDDAIASLLGSLATASGGFRRPARCAKLDHVLGARTRERLVIGIGADELHPQHAAPDHVLDRVAAGAADPMTLMMVPRVSVSRISNGM